jgi:hypothetical protein
VRNNWKAVLAAFVVGAVVMAGVPVMAGNDDPIYLGQRNTARRVTKVKIKNGMVFEATKAGVPAATFNVASGAPIAVNSTFKVTNLNSDQVDGYDADQLRTGWAWVSQSNIPDDVNWSSTTQEVTVPPGGGAILMAGSIDFTNNLGTPDWVTCHFKVDETPSSATPSSLSASERTVYADTGLSAICSTTAAINKPAGTYSVQFLTAGMSVGSIEAGDGTWWAIGVGN